MTHANERAWTARWALAGLGVALAVGCGGSPVPAPRAAIATPDEPAAARDERLAEETLAAGERAAAAGDLEAAERHLRGALATPGLAPDAELAWRIRARLAAVLARAGQPAAAREVAGLMCGGLDPEMTPAFMAPLLAALEEAHVCRGTCGRVASCCRAFVTQMTATTGATIDPEETCRALDEITRGDSVSEEICEQILEGWRQALGNLPGATMPAECR